MLVFCVWSLWKDFKDYLFMIIFCNYNMFNLDMILIIRHITTQYWHLCVIYAITNDADQRSLHHWNTIFLRPLILFLITLKSLTIIYFQNTKLERNFLFFPFTLRYYYVCFYAQLLVHQGIEIIGSYNSWLNFSALSQISAKYGGKYVKVFFIFKEFKYFRWFNTFLWNCQNVSLSKIADAYPLVHCIFLHYLIMDISFWKSNIAVLISKNVIFLLFLLLNDIHNFNENHWSLTKD